MKKIIIIVVIVLILAGGGFFAWKILGADDAKAEDTKEKEMDIETLIETQVHMEPITTNLQSTNNYIIIALSVQTSSVEAKEEFELRLPEMKSIAITTFNATSKNELIGKEGTKPLMESLKKQFNEKIHNGEITDLFITDFKLQ